MTTIYLIRHGEAEGNVTKTFQGQVDAPLTPNGHTQLEYLKKRFALKPLTAIYSSPLQRAYETAKAVRGDRELPIHKDKRLMEFYGGPFEKKPFAELPKKYPMHWWLWRNEPHNFPGIGDSETLYDVQNRMRAAVAEIAAENDGGTVAIASHGCAIRCWLCWALGYPFTMLNRLGWGDNTFVCKVEMNDGRPNVKYYYDTSHLPAEVNEKVANIWWK